MTQQEFVKAIRKVMDIIEHADTKEEAVEAIRKFAGLKEETRED